MSLDPSLDPSLKDVYYLSILFKSMKGLFEIKWFLKDEDKLDFALKILSQIPLFQNPNFKSFYQNRIFTLLEFSDFQITDCQNQLNDSNLKIVIKEGVNESGIYNHLNQKLVENQKVKTDDNFSKDLSEIKIDINSEESSLLNSKNSLKKEGVGHLNLRTLNLSKPHLLIQSVKLAYNFIKEAQNHSSETPLITNEKLQTDFEANLKFIISTNDLNNQINDKNCVLKNLHLEDAFIEAVKNQTSTIANNKIEDIIPFAAVGYHNKEEEKKSYRRKRKKHKVLFKRDQNYFYDEEKNYY